MQCFQPSGITKVSGAACKEQGPDISGSWAIADPDDGCCFLRVHQSTDPFKFEGVQLGRAGAPDVHFVGERLQDGIVVWRSGGLLWRACLDPTGWCMRNGSKSCEKTGEHRGRFSALRQREVQEQDFEEDESADKDRFGLEYQDWSEGLFFSLDREGQEQLLDADGIQVMMEWEKPYMEKCADELQIHPGCDVLEIGFGCGYSANRIQSYRPRSHTIVECSETVLERLKAWAADKPSVRIVDGTWQKRLPELGTFDRVFFDDYGQPGQSDREMAVNCPSEEYKKVYDESESHFNGFLNILFQWHSHEGTRISGYLVHQVQYEREGVFVDFKPYPVKAPPHCDYFFGEHAVVPTFIKSASIKRERLGSCDSQSTRSRSRSRSFGRTSSSRSDHASDAEEIDR